MENIDFVRLIQNWYEINKRDLPWRTTRNPYEIWLSEIILQQTRVAQGLPYFNRFIEAYPEVASLAAAEEQEILRLWQGLGYYSRARNLHSTAKDIVQNYSGKFPQSYNNLLSLKGIGTYTAAAIASFAFGEKVAVLDGNVYRVLSRYFGITDNIAVPATKKIFLSLANSLMPENNSEIYNQAIMEFGALQCVPSSPSCESCPLAQDCYARKHKMQNALPVKSKSKIKRHRYFNYLLLRNENKLYLKKRNGSDIWKGLFEFKMLETEHALSSNDISEWMKTNSITGKIIKESGTYKHVLSHQIINARFWEIQTEHSSLAEEDGGTYFTINDIDDLPKPVLINNYLREHIF